jgi:outer membrane biosynthesis protein TonB
VKLPEMKTGLTISALVHAALLLWGLLSFAARPLEAKPTDGMPIDLISDKEFSELAKGVKNAPKKDTPSPLVEKVAEPNKVEDAKPKAVEKKIVEAAKTEPEPPPPAPEPKSKPEQAKPEKKEPPKTDQIAETLKKEEAKKKAEEKKQKAEQQKPHPAFDPNKIAALLDKRDPMRQASAGETLSQSPSLGYVGGSSAQLSQTEIDALRRRLAQCWSPPVGAADAGRIQVVLRVLFKPDGSLAGLPQLVAAPASASLGPAMAESAKRALLTCQPFTMLRPEHYKQWQDMEITFDPRDMFGGG